MVSIGRRYPQEPQAPVPDDPNSTWNRIRKFIGEAGTVANTALAAGPAIINNADNGMNPDAIAQEAVTGGQGISRLQQNAGSGILQLPATVPAAVDVARIGVPSVISAAGNMMQEGDQNFVGELGKEFISRVIDPETMKAIGMMNMMEEETFKKMNPDATDEEVQAHLASFQDSDEYYNMIQKQMPLGMRIAENANALANQFVGMDTRPDKQSSLDDIEQIIGQAGVGLPSSVIRGISKATTKVVGESVMKSIPGRIATRAVEAVTPMTLPMSPSNVAINTVVPAAINEGIRTAQDRPTLLNPQATESVDEEPPSRFPEAVPVPLPRPDGSQLQDTSYSPDANPIVSDPIATAALSVAAFGAVFSAPGIRKAFRDGAEAAVKSADEERVAAMSLNAGKTLEDQSSQMEPVLNPTRGILDRNASVTAAANKFKKPEDTTTVPRIDAIMSKASAMNSAEAVNNTLNYGVLDGLPNTIPFREIQRNAQALAPEEYDLFSKYLFATMRKQDTDIQAKNLQNEINQNLVELSNATTRGDTRSVTDTQAKLSELQTKYQGVLNDSPEMRTSAQDWTRDDVNAAIKLGEMNPKVAAMQEMFKKVSNDLIEFERKAGVITDDEAARRLQTRPIYVKLQERSYADTPNPVVRAGRRFYDKMTTPQSEHGLFPHTRPRNVSGEGAKVNVMQDPLAALRTSVIETVQGAHANKARREIVDTLIQLPDAKGNLLRPVEFDMGRGRKVTSISDAQYRARLTGGGSLADQIAKKGDRVISIFRGGKLEFYEFADAQTARALQFAPVHTVPFMHGLRKTWQAMTTGVAAPWFAPISLAFDVSAGMATARAGRSFGYIDTYARKLSNESAFVNRVADTLGDPTAYLSSSVAVGTMAVRRAQRAFGHKVASDLINNSGVFQLIAQLPGGRKLVSELGESAVRSFDNSVHAVMFKNMSTSFGHMNESAAKIKDYKIKASQGGKLAPIWNGYVALLESVQMGARTSFFSQNYFRLQAKAAKEGRKITQQEIDMLARDTQLLAGDLSRVSGNKYVQYGTDIFPYGNPIMQGMQQTINAMIPPFVAKGANQALGTNFIEDRVSHFWTKAMTGSVMPAVMTASIWSDWPEGEDYVYNRTPSWQQFSTLSFPSVEALEERITTGKWPKFDPKYVNRIRIAPELSPIIQGTLSGMRQLGIIGKPPTLTDRTFLGDLGTAFKQMSSFILPPSEQLFLALNGSRFDAEDFMTGQGGISDQMELPKGGANSGSITYNGVVSQTLYETIGALAATTGRIAMQTFDIGQKAYRDEGWMAGIQKAGEVAGYEFKRRLPEITIPGVYNSRERLFASTPESEIVYGAERALDPIIGQGKQISIETDKSGEVESLRKMGYEMPMKIKNPALKQLAQVVYDTIRKKGPYKAADDQYRKLRLQINALESTRHKVAQDDYHKQRNGLVTMQQAVIRQQAGILRNLESALQEKVGPSFEKVYGSPFTFEALSKAVQEDTSK